MTRRRLFPMRDLGFTKVNPGCPLLTSGPHRGPLVVFCNTLNAAEPVRFSRI